MNKNNDFFDISLAKGIRRFAAKHHIQTLSGDIADGFEPLSSFEGNARKIVNHYKANFGKENVCVFRFNKKIVSFLCVFHGTEGLSIASVHEFYKKDVFHMRRNRPDRSLANHAPIVMTAHFVERFIQSFANTKTTIANAIYALWRATQTEMYAAVTGDNDIYPVWRHTGEFAFATPEMLILGVIPVNDDLVCLTVIRADRLEENKMKLWLSAQNQKNGLLIKKN